MARRASLQGGTTIQTPQALFEWCNENILNIKSFFVSSSEIDENKKFLESRFDKAKTIPGTLSFHSFTPNSDCCSIKVRDVSLSNVSKEFVVINVSTSNVDFCDVKIGSVVASIYEDGKWYLGKVLSKDDINLELNIHFYKPAGEEAKITGFKLSHKDDTATVPLENVLKISSSFAATTRRGRTFKIDLSEFKDIEDRFSNVMANGI